MQSLTSRVLAVPSGLLARAARELRGAHGHARAVQAQVQRRRHRLAGGERRHHLPLVVGDLAAERLGRPLDVLGGDRHAGQVAQEHVALVEADRRAHQPHHAQHPRRERGALQAEGRVARAEAGRARRTVEVGPLDRQGPQDAGDRLGPAVHVARELAATGAGRRPAVVVRGVGVDPVLDGAGRHPQRFAAGGRLDGLEVPVLDGAGAYERLDLGDDFGREGRLEPPFWAAAWAAASGVIELGIGPVLAGVPEGVNVAAEPLAGRDLLPHASGLRGGHEAGLRAPAHGPREAIVRPVTGRGALGTRAPRLTAFDVALGERSTPHRRGRRHLGGQGPHRRGNVGDVGHNPSLRP